MDLINKLVFVDGVDVTPLGVQEVNAARGWVRTARKNLEHKADLSGRSSYRHYGKVEIKNKEKPDAKLGKSLPDK